MNNNKIIEQLQNGNQERAFSRLYKFYPKIEKYVQINSGSKAEALDVFQEALIILFRKVENLSVDSPIQIDGFLVNTCKLLWSNELRKKKVRQKGNTDGLDNLAYEDEIAFHIEKEAKLNTVEEIIKQLGKKCKTILDLFYNKTLSMDAVAKKMGYKSVQSAKVQKYKCMEHARNLASSINESKK